MRDWLRDAEPALSAAGISLREWRRDWDGLIWPHATAGFFKVRDKIPRILAEAGLAEAGLAETGLAETGSAKTGLLKAGRA